MKKLSLFVLAFLSMPLAYSQHLNTMDQANEHAQLFGKNFELKINEVIRLTDSLSVRLFSFSHKYAMTGGPTKATAYLAVSANGLSDTIQLSVHGGSGKSPQMERYDTLKWKVYKFKLTKFNYDKSIELMITKE